MTFITVFIEYVLEFPLLLATISTLISTINPMLFHMLCKLCKG